MTYIWATIGAAVVLASPAIAQTPVSLPPLSDTGQVVQVNGAPLTLLMTPTHAQFETRLYQAEQANALTDTSGQHLQGTSSPQVAQHAAEWLTHFPNAKGFQSIPTAELAVTAGNDSLANSLFQQWLATPGLSTTDRAAANLAMLEQYCITPTPARLRAAERLLDALTALAPTEITPQINAHQTIALAAYASHDDATLLRHAEARLALIVAIPEYWVRVNYVLKDVPIDLMMRLYPPDAAGASRRDALRQTLRAATRPVRAPVRAGDASTEYNIAQQQMERRLAHAALLGQPAPAIRAHAWLNDTTRTTSGIRSAQPATQTLADGVVRILAFGRLGGPQSIRAFMRLEKLQQQLHGTNVQVLFVTNTVGYWGTDLVSPDSEVAHLSQYYVHDLHLTMPIAIWAGTKQAAADGSQLPEASPNDSTYTIYEIPSFIVVDGHGRVRYLASKFGSDDRLYEQLRTVVTNLTP